jgi:hypothetical protein
MKGARVEIVGNPSAIISIEIKLFELHFKIPSVVLF